MSEKKERLKNAVFNAVLISATLVLVFISAFYHIMSFNGSEYSAEEYAVITAVITIIGEIGVLVIAYLHGRRLVSAFSAFLFGVCTVCYFIIALSGASALGGEGTDALLLVLTFPSEAFASIGRGTVTPGIITLVITILSVAAAVIPRRGREEGK
ncbi:MAG: hypothetical protein IKX86_03805 [Clostridia bacterium]|nr:hypothetical protein [Clostridia bacterium]